MISTYSSLQFYFISKDTEALCSSVFTVLYTSHPSLTFHFIVVCGYDIKLLTRICFALMDVFV